MISRATMAPSGREIEYKLRAKAPIEIARVDALLRETGLPVRSRGSVVHVDVYLDTRDHALRRRGFGLRMRRADDAPCAVLTCTDRGRRDGARFDRREIEAPWLGAAPPPTVPDLPPEMRRILPAGEVGALVALSTGTIPGALALAGIVLASALFLGRAFCGWICPFGAMHHGIASHARVPTMHVNIDVKFRLE